MCQEAWLFDEDNLMNSQATFSAVSVVFVLSASLNDVKPLSPIVLSVCYVSNRIINKVLSCVV